jgi:hypothetical protein
MPVSPRDLPLKSNSPTQQFDLSGPIGSELGTRKLTVNLFKKTLGCASYGIMV